MQKPFLLLLIAAVTVPVVAGSTVNRTVDGYTVTLRQQPSTLSAGERAELTVTVRDSNGTRLQGQGIFLSIQNSAGEETFSSTGLTTSERGTVSLDYLFNDPGIYRVEAGFKPRNTFLSTTFEVDVTGIHTQRRETDSILIIIAIAALTVGYVVGLAREFRRPEL